MPVDPQVQVLLDATGSQPPIRSLPVEQVRAMFRAHPLPGVSAGEVAIVVDRCIRGPNGRLGLRVYTPHGTGPFPLLVFFHGGGFVVCDLDTHDAICRNLCAGAACVVVSVDYRLAPEHRFPAAHDDCLTATRWAAEHTRELGANPERVVVGGDSAGGLLAAATALRLRDEGSPRLTGQLLLYPTTDLGTPVTASMTEYAEGYGLAAADLPWFWEKYLNSPSDAADPRASPLRAPDLRGLPPTMVLTAECDPLRDEGERYAERLLDAGVPTVLSRQAGMIHAFLLFTGMISGADRALGEACAWLRGTLG
ncbi:alpha/beta hydrolase [Belnapia sp. T6]|uniref:Alpha/beta hydrolase n=1 Tax=Belnapia mucosa TaxID=2804532 RepID=A0ABS1UYV5_9PROT|nr:alpha/beta hydrolase [Belnapia mucosa]MBL6454580.1 alpha/beta hydrolase [Belnapia mucosa]